MTLDVAPIEPKTEGTRRFLAQSRRRMLIDNEWVDAASGRSFDTLNPATGEVLGQVPAGEAVDVDRAVAAARRALESSAWRDMVPAQRARLLWTMADLI